MASYDDIKAVTAILNDTNHQWNDHEVFNDNPSLVETIASHIAFSIEGDSIECAATVVDNDGAVFSVVFGNQRLVRTTFMNGAVTSTVFSCADITRVILYEVPNLAMNRFGSSDEQVAFGLQIDGEVFTVPVDKYTTRNTQAELLALLPKLLSSISTTV